MNRKEFLSNVKFGTALILLPACIGGLAGCEKTIVEPQNVDFTVDISSGPLASNGGYTIQNGVIIARTNSGDFLAVSAACTHQGTNVRYYSSSNNFICPNHGAKYDSTGKVTQGPATRNLAQYNTELTGTLLKVFS